MALKDGRKLIAGEEIRAALAGTRQAGERIEPHHTALHCVHLKQAAPRIRREPAGMAGAYHDPPSACETRRMRGKCAQGAQLLPSPGFSTICTPSGPTNSSAQRLHSLSCCLASSSSRPLPFGPLNRMVSLALPAPFCECAHPAIGHPGTMGVPRRATTASELCAAKIAGAAAACLRALVMNQSSVPRISTGKTHSTTTITNPLRSRLPDAVFKSAPAPAAARRSPRRVRCPSAYLPRCARQTRREDRFPAPR